MCVRVGWGVGLHRCENLFEHQRAVRDVVKIHVECREDWDYISLQVAVVVLQSR